MSHAQLGMMRQVTLPYLRKVMLLAPSQRSKPFAFVLFVSEKKDVSPICFRYLRLSVSLRLVVSNLAGISISMCS